MQKLSREEVRKFLAEESLFRDAAPAVLDRLAELAHQTAVPQGNTLFRMGQPCDRLHLVIAGSGLLTKGSQSGRQLILHRASTGDLVGEVPFFDGLGYPATFVAESDCLVLYFPRHGLLEMFEKQPTLSFSLLGMTMKRLRMMASIVEQLSFEDAEHRLWDYLVGGSHNSTANSDSFPRVVDPMPTREHIASSIGTVREVVSRRLSRLVDSGHVRIEGRRLILLKPLA